MAEAIANASGTSLLPSDSEKGILSEQVSAAAGLESTYLHTWTIREVIRISAENPIIHSAPFVAGDREWNLTLYTAGANIGTTENSDYAVPSLQCKANPVRVTFAAFTFHNKNGCERNATSGNFSFCGGAWPDIGSSPLNFMRRERLFASENGFLVDDTLVLSLEFRFRLLGADAVKPVSFAVEPAMLTHNFSALLSPAAIAHADIQLRAGSERFPVHRCVLAAQSVVFARMFQAQLPFAEAKDVSVTIEGAKPVTVRRFVHFLYSGVVAPSTRPLALWSWEEIHELLLLADRYEVAPLRALLVHSLASKMTMDHARDAWALGELRAEMAPLKFAALSCVVRSVDAHALARSWLQMRPHQDSLIEAR